MAPLTQTPSRTSSPTSEPRRIGIYGGSFDPPHLGHVFAAHLALSSGEIDELWVIPVFSHAFSKALSPFEARLRMCQLAFCHLREVHILDTESELEPPSYSINTIELLRDRFPSYSFRWLMGSDLVAEKIHWHRFQELEKLAPPLVLARRGHSNSSTSTLLPEVSSSEIRQGITEGNIQDFVKSGLLPRTVAAYINTAGLYLL